MTSGEGVAAAHRSRTWAVTDLVAVIVLGAGLGIAFWARSGFVVSPQVFLYGPLAYLMLLVTVAAQTTAGVVLAVRRPGNVIGWLVLLFALDVTVPIFADGYLAFAASGGVAPLDQSWVAWVSSTIVLALGAVLAVGIGVYFPDGHPLSRRWLWWLPISGIGALSFAFGLGFAPGPLLLLPAYANPLAAPSLDAVTLVAREAGIALLAASAIAVAVMLAKRYRSADLVGRQQLRLYVAAAGGTAAGFLAYVVALATLAPSAPLGELVTVLFYLSLALPPVAQVFAILRYRLYDIDTIVGRAFVVGALTAILAGVYAASISLFQALFVGVIGEHSDAALVLTTLILATTFTPIRRRLERAVEHWRETPAAVAGGPFGDPVFVADLDARIRAIVAETAASGQRSRSSSRSTKRP